MNMNCEWFAVARQPDVYLRWWQQMDYLVCLGLVVTVTAAAVADANDGRNARLAIAAASNAFAFDLYELLREEEDNLIFSPVSASAALTMVYLGAGGDTALQMRKAMHLPDDAQRISDGYRILVDSFQSSNQTTLRMANKLYIEKRRETKESFQRTALSSFRAGVERVDFLFAVEEARGIINRWVEEFTDGKIKDLVAEGLLDETTAMVLVNAVYFKGSWLHSFYPGLTEPQAFHISATNKTDVQMMHRSAEFSYCASVPSLNARAIELPYFGDGNYRLRMVILLPNEIDGLAETESKIKHIDLKELQQCLVKQAVNLSLPKFSIGSTFNLDETLPKLGIRDLFDQGLANLTGIADHPLYVDKVIQKAFVEVDEFGTIASAATGVVMDIRISLGETIEFSVDRPFMFWLVDSDDTILFVGRVKRPRS